MCTVLKFLFLLGVLWMTVSAQQLLQLLYGALWQPFVPYQYTTGLTSFFFFRVTMLQSTFSVARLWTERCVSIMDP